MTKIKDVAHPGSPPLKAERQNLETITKYDSSVELDIDALVLQYGEGVSAWLDFTDSYGCPEVQISFYRDEENPSYNEELRNWQVRLKAWQDYQDALEKNARIENRKKALEDERAQYKRLKAKFEGES